jgi:hypothetical protein
MWHTLALSPPPVTPEHNTECVISVPIACSRLARPFQRGLKNFNELSLLRTISHFDATVLASSLRVDPNLRFARQNSRLWHLIRALVSHGGIKLARDMKLMKALLRTARGSVPRLPPTVSRW